MPRFDTATGRYIYMTIDGIEYRVYFEETGAGIPLLLQHTAGADARRGRSGRHAYATLSRFGGVVTPE